MWWLLSRTNRSYRTLHWDGQGQRLAQLLQDGAAQPAAREQEWRDGDGETVDGQRGENRENWPNAVARLHALLGRYSRCNSPRRAVRTYCG